MSRVLRTAPPMASRGIDQEWVEARLNRLDEGDRFVLPSEAARASRGVWIRGLSQYDPSTKARNLLPLLHHLEGNGLLGKVIVNAGGGQWNDLLGRFCDDLRRRPLCQPEKQIINLDISMTDPVQQLNELNVCADIETPTPVTFTQKLLYLKILQFLGRDRKDKTPAVDTILFSDVLNYVDYKKSIEGLARYLKPGGRVIIFNMPGRGFTEQFSPQGITSNRELLGYMRENHQIEYLAEVDTSLHTYPSVYDFGDRDWILLVARKN